jgi:hypothetical protein
VLVELTDGLYKIAPWSKIISNSYGPN